MSSHAGGPGVRCIHGVPVQKQRKGFYRERDVSNFRTVSKKGAGQFLNSPLKDLSYEIGMVVAEGDLVMVHGRYVGWGPKPLVAVDIFKVKNGKVVEHWDVMQEEVPASSTASGNPMFTPA
jgi:predicted SnoaL-like aldol condensation-catalyzing enzyme